MPLLAAFALLLAAPAPAPAAPPAPTPHMQWGPFIVFFDWDSSEISPRSAAILDDVIAIRAAAPDAPIYVAGHSDSSGPASANLRLSRRRAEQVKSYLVDHGVPADMIESAAFGEGHPLVDTADGKRERENRRAELVFGPLRSRKGR